MNFIYTTNEKIKDKLLQNNYTLIKKENNLKDIYIFNNDGNLTFDKNDIKEIFFSNEIHL